MGESADQILSAKLESLFSKFDPDHSAMNEIRFSGLAPLARAEDFLRYFRSTRPLGAKRPPPPKGSPSLGTPTVNPKSLSASK